MSEDQPNAREVPDASAMDQFSAHLDRGWDLINRGDFNGAQLSAEKSLELDGQSPEAHNLLGYVRAAQGDAEDALEHYRQAIALDDSFVEAMLNAAEVLIHPIHDFDAAMGMVDEALDFAEGDEEVADAMLLKFDAHMHQGDREAAARVVEALPAGVFDNARLDFLVGRARFEVGQVDAAEALLLRAVQLEPDNSDAHYYLGLIHDAKQRGRESTLCFLRTRELDARTLPVHWALPPDHFERRVQDTIRRLEAPLNGWLDGALIAVGDVPGLEIVADGVDPRAGILLDALTKKGEPPKVGRMFVYQRNVERVSEGLLHLEDDLLQIIRTELMAAFPEAARAAGLEQPAPPPSIPGAK